MTKMRELAQKATPGPWEWGAGKYEDSMGYPKLRNAVLGRVSDDWWGPDGNGKGKDYKDAPPHGSILQATGCCCYGLVFDNEADKPFIAACSPDRILAYEDCVEALRVIKRITSADMNNPFHTVVRETAKAALATLDTLEEP